MEAIISLCILQNIGMIFLADDLQCYGKFTEYLELKESYLVKPLSDIKWWIAWFNLNKTTLNSHIKKYRPRQLKSMFPILLCGEILNGFHDNTSIFKFLYTTVSRHQRLGNSVGSFVCIHVSVNISNKRVLIGGSSKFDYTSTKTKTEW